MRLINRLLISALSILLAYGICAAQGQKEIDPDKDSPQEQYLFVGEVIKNGINVRTDSSTNSEIICKVNKNQRLHVLKKLYEWYKVRLPSHAELFIKKEFVSTDNESVGTVSNDNVNIRLRPDLSSPILGRAHENDRVSIMGTSGEWYRIKPVKNSTGWIHGIFVKQAKEKEVEPTPKGEEKVRRVSITVEGIIKPKAITHVATHKLITEDKRLYLLKSDKEDLSSFNRRKIKATGTLENPTANNPIIVVEKIEALD